MPDECCAGQSQVISMGAITMEQSPCLKKICMTHIFVKVKYANTLLPFEMISLNGALISAWLCWIFWWKTSKP